jgi:hypothetical protein
VETFEELFKIKTITRLANLKGISLTIVTNNLYLQNLYNLDTCLISQQTARLPAAAAAPKLWHSSDRIFYMNNLAHYNSELHHTNELIDSEKRN